MGHGISTKEAAASAAQRKQFPGSFPQSWCLSSSKQRTLLSQHQYTVTQSNVRVSLTTRKAKNSPRSLQDAQAGDCAASYTSLTNEVDSAASSAPHNSSGGVAEHGRSRRSRGGAANIRWQQRRQQLQHEQQRRCTRQGGQRRLRPVCSAVPGLPPVQVTAQVPASTSLLFCARSCRAVLVFSAHTPTSPSHRICPPILHTARFDPDRMELVNDDLGVAYPIRAGIPRLVPSEGRPLDTADGPAVDR